MTYPNDFFILANQLIEAGRFIDSKGWVPATSGNFSARLSDDSIAITVSGTHKGCLQQSDIMLIDSDAQSLDGKKPSAEAVLHTTLYKRYPDINAILHPHSMTATLASQIFKTEVVLQDYELLKALPGIDTHEARIVVPIFANDQNIPRLAEQVDRYIDQHGAIHAYIIAGHGLYTWGDSVLHALRLLETLDFLLSCELHLYGVKKI
ncbi:Methylthioribulose-1-phosphate dehydratase [Crenothrix polyspora]|uniref:Methylthioribulose-1-phosphate dehydratase n=1 Tax=Crenothrix polyspora TaxID=360316 RepID=A0A1R4HA94_9GAMM|nr:methylthioribulose 1-phosphate dehydratase [Crenothrix polyspora]SJM92780.1 Methylthioribulose-1-phosphate dehydratase [Crenothrix polyspora]